MGVPRILHRDAGFCAKNLIGVQHVYSAVEAFPVSGKFQQILSYWQTRLVQQTGKPMTKYRSAYAHVPTCPHFLTDILQKSSGLDSLKMGVDQFYGALLVLASAYAIAIGAAFVQRAAKKAEKEDNADRTVSSSQPAMAAMEGFRGRRRRANRRREAWAAQDPKCK